METDYENLVSAIVALMPDHFRLKDVRSLVLVTAGIEYVPSLDNKIRYWLKKNKTLVFERAENENGRRAIYSKVLLA